MGKQNKKKPDSTITAAIVTVAGTIIVALITVFGNALTKPPNPTSAFTPTTAVSSTLTETPSPVPSATYTREPELIFGPQSGILNDTNSLIFRPDYPNIKVHNSIISIVFTNSSDTDDWTYSVYFRDTPGIQSQFFTVCNCGTWTLYSITPENGYKSLYNGTADNLNLAKGKSNHISLVVKDLTVSIVINGKSINDKSFVLDVDLGHGGFAITASSQVDYAGLQILSLDSQ